jgi:hypothetical protein
MQFIPPAPVRTKKKSRKLRLVHRQHPDVQIVPQWNKKLIQKDEISFPTQQLS